MAKSRVREAAATVVAAVLVAMACLVSPVSARACACGAVVADARVNGEVAIITWNGSRQSVDLWMRLNGSTSEAAWIMPTPRGATIELGNGDAFGELAQVTAPRVEVRRSYTPNFSWLTGRRSGDSGGAQAPPVEVVEEQRVGPFRVTTLAGSDPQAVNAWLRKNNFPTRDNLTGVFGDYLKRGWVLQAVKLTPSAEAATFEQALPPLRLGFATTTPTYPMKLSSKATSSQPVRLYLLGTTPLGIKTEAAPSQPLEMIYSGGFDPTEILPRSGLPAESWLTAFEGDLSPGNITGDFAFRSDPSITNYQRTEVVRHDVGADLTRMVVLGVLLLAPVVIIVGVVRWVSRRTEA